MISKISILLALVLLSIIQPVPACCEPLDDILVKAQRYMETWDHDEALVLFDQALEIEQGRSRIWFERGLARREIGDREGALLDFDQALALDPNEAHYIYERAIVREYVRDYKGTVEDCNRFLEVDPDSEIILSLRAGAKSQLEDYVGAVADYSAAIEMTPNNPETYYFRGFARAEHGDWDGAIADFTTVMTMDPLDGFQFDKRDVALLRRAQVKYRAQDFQGAVADCDTALERDASNLEALFIRGLTWTATSDYSAAIRDFDLVIATYPLPRAFHKRGLAKQGLGDEAGANADFEEARSLGYEVSDDPMD